MLVLATRPLVEPLPAEYRQWQQMPNVHHVKLGPLPAHDIVSLLSQRLGVNMLPETLATFIQEKGEGYPFFSEELTYALRDAGLIDIVDGECHLNADGEELRRLNLPDTVEGVIASRIDRLTPSQQLTLKVASVIGRVFPISVLHAIYPIEIDKARLTNDLIMLQQLDITPLDTPEPELAYLFKHAITQKVTYNRLLFAQRKELHRAIAQWYETHYSSDLSPFYALLAFHWEKAEVESPTTYYLSKAGNQALRGGTYKEAVGFLGKVLESPPMPRLLRRSKLTGSNKSGKPIIVCQICLIVAIILNEP